MAAARTLGLAAARGRFAAVMAPRVAPLAAEVARRSPALPVPPPPSAPAPLASRFLGLAPPMPRAGPLLYFSHHHHNASGGRPGGNGIAGLAVGRHDKDGAKGAGEGADHAADDKGAAKDAAAWCASYTGKAQDIAKWWYDYANKAQGAAKWYAYANKQAMDDAAGHALENKPTERGVAAGGGARRGGESGGGEGAGLAAALAGAALARTAGGSLQSNKPYRAADFALSFAAARLGMARRGYAAAPGDHATDAFGDGGLPKRAAPRGYSKKLLRQRLRPGDKKRDAEIHNLKRLVLKLHKKMDSLVKSNATYRQGASNASKEMLLHVKRLPFTVTFVLVVVLICMAYFTIVEVLPVLLIFIASQVLDLVIDIIEEVKDRAGLEDTEKLKEMVESLAKKFAETLWNFFGGKAKEEFRKTIKEALKSWNWF